MLRIRFQRTGKRNRPFFRIVVIERSAPPQGGRPVEIVGFYDPIKKEHGVKKERVLYWLEKGAQLSDPVYNLCVRLGIIKGKKRQVHSKPEISDQAESPEETETKETEPNETSEEAREDSGAQASEEKEGTSEEG